MSRHAPLVVLDTKKSNNTFALGKAHKKNSKKNFETKIIDFFRPGPAGADWDSSDAYTADHCKFPDGEFAVKDCDDVICKFYFPLSGRLLYFLSGTAASVSGNCENNVREVIVNGEIELESCSVVVWSDWTACPAVTDTCAGRPVSKSYRFSAHADTEHKDCPASTLACRKFLLFSTILFLSGKPWTLNPVNRTLT